MFPLPPKILTPKAGTPLPRKCLLLGGSKMPLFPSSLGAPSTLPTEGTVLGSVWV